jgi:hypothetical protein
MKIEVEYFDDPGDSYVVLLADGGALKQPDGSIKLRRPPNER